jgi:hypothetical protein
MSHFSDSIIARWQRSKEFCNKIGPKAKSMDVRSHVSFQHRGGHQSRAQGIF